MSVWKTRPFRRARAKLTQLLADYEAESERQLQLTPFKRTALNVREYALRQDAEEILAAEYGFVDHPKRHILWSTAWDLGHDKGYLNVHIMYDTLSILLDPEQPTGGDSHG